MCISVQESGRTEQNGMEKVNKTQKKTAELARSTHGLQSYTHTNCSFSGDACSPV